MDSTSDRHLDILPIDVSHCVKVTVATEPMVDASIGVSHSSPPSHPEEMKRLQRQTRNFTETDIKDFAAFLEQGMAQSTGLVLVLTTLPAFDDDKKDLCYVIDNIDVTDTPGRVYSRGSMRLGLWEAQRMPAFQLVLSRLPQPASLQLVQRRLEDAAELLEFYQSTCTTVLEQQRNLLNMTFNLETIGQSQTVMRLNALAFVFLPLSFVASIFGMTTIATPAVWYIAVALPTLIATVGAVFIINRATDYLQSRKLKSQQKDQSVNPRGINLKAPWSWLVKKITNTKFVGSIASHTASLDKVPSSSPGPPGQNRPKHSVQIIDGHCPIRIVDSQSPDPQQSEPSIRAFDGHSPGQQQPESPTGIFNEQSPGQQQLELSTNVLNEPSPSQQQLAPSTRIFDEQFLLQQQPSIGDLNRRYKRVIDSHEVYRRRTILGKRYRKPEDAYNQLLRSPEVIYINRPRGGENTYNRGWMGEEISGEAYGYRVKGVARVDSNFSDYNTWD
ncbi:hypothetical protein V8C34DRAFT_317923 [Trichoderma compactum]